MAATKSKTPGSRSATRIGQARVWLPDGRTRVVPLLEKPQRGAKLKALDVRGTWNVSDMRATDDRDIHYDIWVEPS